MRIACDDATAAAFGRVAAVAIDAIDDDQRTDCGRLRRPNRQCTDGQPDVNHRRRLKPKSATNAIAELVAAEQRLVICTSEWSTGANALDECARRPL